MTQKLDAANIAFPSVLTDFLEQPDEVRRRLEEDADAYTDDFRRLTGTISSRHRPLLDSSNLAAAVFTPQLEILAATDRFTALDPDLDVDPEMVQQALLSRQAVIVPTSVVGTGGDQSALMIYGSTATVRYWNLPPVIADALSGQGDRVLVLTTYVAQESAIARACETYGLTGLETRVVLAILEAGSIREAAEVAGIRYATAREAVSTALKKCGTSRLPGMIAKISLLALGILPDDTPVEDLLREQWGLTPRQASIAVSIADGASREEVARYTGLSLATVKKELGAVFATLDVSSAATLSRLISDFRAVASLTQSDGELLGYLDPVSEPLKITHLDDGRSVGWSDYPGASDIPVLYVHSSMSTRIAPRPLIRQMQARGRRLIALDRPGFGMSEPLRDCLPHQHFQRSAEDCIAFLDKVGIDRVDVISRGAAQYLLAIARLRPDLIRAAVIVNPDPPTAMDRRRTGPLGAFKEFYRKRPALIRIAAKVIAANLTPSRFQKVMTASMKGSPPDEKAIATTQVVDDYFRSVRPFATGRIEGYVAEQVAFATMQCDEPLAGTLYWCVMGGEYDTLHDARRAAEYWEQILPDAQHETVPDAGRFLISSHVGLVADRLGELAAAAQ